MSPGKVQVDINARGGWMIELPDQHDPIVCETFKDAQRLAYLCAERYEPCELLVHDAYHRVLYRTLVSRDDEHGVGNETPGGSRPGAGEVERRHRHPDRQTGAD